MRLHWGILLPGCKIAHALGSVEPDFFMRSWSLCEKMRRRERLVLQFLFVLIETLYSQWWQSTDAMPPLGAARS